MACWPTCREAVVTRLWEPTEGSGPPLEGEDNHARSVRRSRTAIRRYGRHNDLTQMPTLTYAERPNLDRVSDDLRHFWRRFERASGESPGPYCAVPEWGKKTGRLHLHVGVTWWDRLDAVEVCELCARDALRAKRSDIPAAGSFCIGCLWGHGFVGRAESNSTGRQLSGYLSKYLGKDLAAPMGRWRYRVAQGYAPTCERFDCSSESEAVSVALEVVGDGRAPASTWNSDDAEGWHGPHVVAMDWLSDVA